MHTKPFREDQLQNAVRRHHTCPERPKAAAVFSALSAPSPPGLRTVQSDALRPFAVTPQ